VATSERVAVIVCCGEEPASAEVLLRLSNSLLSVHRFTMPDTHIGEGWRGEYEGWYFSNWLLPVEPDEARVAFPVVAVRTAVEAANLKRWPHGVVAPDGRLYVWSRFAKLLSAYPECWVVPMVAYSE
jgi:hypothetical protein